MEKIKERNINLDLLKIIACLLVITIHVTANNLINVFEIGTLPWKINVFFNCLSRSSVPIFMMISGKFILEKKDAPTVKQLFHKYIFRILKIYIFWSLFYTVSKLIIVGRSISLTTNLFLAYLSPHYHLWYLAALLGVYLLLPALFAIKDYKNGMYLKYFIYVFIAFGIIRHSLLMLPYGLNENLVRIPKFLNIIEYPLVEFSGYFLLGYYISNKVKIKFGSLNLGITFLITVLTATFLTWKVTMINGTFYTNLLSNFVIFTFLEAILLYKLFLELDLSKISLFIQEVIVKLSSFTLPIYLIHVFVLEEIFGRVLVIKNSNMLINVPISVIATFIISLIISIIIKRIKILNNYIS